jgi:hypothetical protein
MEVLPMAVVTHVLLRGLSHEEYDRLRTETGWLERPPDGGYLHVTWWEGNDCHNTDAWESEEKFNAFGAERLGPAMAKLGINIQPEITFHPAYEVYAIQAVKLV